MRGDLGFDPNAHDYGPATESIRTILNEWAATDWFEVPTATNAHGAALIRRHNRVAHLRDADAFAFEVEIRFATGNLADLVGWCDRARANTVNWRVDLLEPLSRDQRAENGWSIDREGAALASLDGKPGALFVSFGTSAYDTERDAIIGASVIWNIHIPRFGDVDGRAQFYVQAAHGNMLDAILWQLAKSTNDLDDNPFWPLVSCYRGGFYPFYLDRENFVLFRFG